MQDEGSSSCVCEHGGLGATVGTLWAGLVLCSRSQGTAHVTVLFYPLYYTSRLATSINAYNRYYYHSLLPYWRYYINLVNRLL